jgi:drug/metabolite transporter (DMT)-like permease
MSESMPATVKYEEPARFRTTIRWARMAVAFASGAIPVLVVLKDSATLTDVAMIVGIVLAIAAAFALAWVANRRGARDDVTALLSFTMFLLVGVAIAATIVVMNRQGAFPHPDAPAPQSVERP